MGLRHMGNAQSLFSGGFLGAGHPCTAEGFGIDMDTPAPGVLSPLFPQVLGQCRGQSLRGSRGCSGTLRRVLGHWNVGMLSGPELGVELS